MGWSTPRTWTAGEIPTAETFNTHVRDQFIWLKDPSHAQYIQNFGSSYTTTSTSFVDVDASALALTLTTYGGRLLISIRAGLSNNTGSQSVIGDIAIDGSRIGNATYGLISNINPNTYFPDRTFWTQPLAAGAHTIKLQWKVTGGTGALSFLEWWIREAS